MESIKEVKTETVIREALKIGDRTLYPVIQVLTLKTKGQNFFGAWISPLAIVVVEPTQEYVIPLTDETITLEQILEMVPSLKEKTKKVQREH